jgi:hypothetical protein
MKTGPLRAMAFDGGAQPISASMRAAAGYRDWLDCKIGRGAVKYSPQVCPQRSRGLQDVRRGPASNLPRSIGAFYDTNPSKPMVLAPESPRYAETAHLLSRCPPLPGCRNDKQAIACGECGAFTLCCTSRPKSPRRTQATCSSIYSARQGVGQVNWRPSATEPMIGILPIPFTVKGGTIAGPASTASRSTMWELGVAVRLQPLRSPFATGNIETY